jgi:hypothetical protein
LIELYQFIQINQSDRDGTMRGGKREGAGRPPLAANKTSKDVRELAQKFGTMSIQGLIDIAQDDEQPTAARVSAYKEVLDRGLGKSLQQVAHAGEEGQGPIKIEFSWAASKGS